MIWSIAAIVIVGTLCASGVTCFQIYMQHRFTNKPEDE